MGPSVPGASTTMALWPKRSKNSSPGSIVSTPIRGTAAARAGNRQSSNSSRYRQERSGIGMHADHETVHAPGIGTADPEVEAAQGQFLARFRQVADGGNHQAADGVVLVVGEVGAELPVEIGDRRQRIHHVLAIGQGGDQAGAVAVVVLVVYLADDLLEHVLDGDQAGDAAVFIDDDGHVVARQPELLE